jgi:hypothetical protein
MKKAYSTPDIFFENFSLSTNIAAGCEEKPFNLVEGCGVKWSKGQILFVDGVSDNCTKKVTSGDANYNGLCYHNPSESYNVFFS